MSSGRLSVISTPIGNLGDLSPRAGSTIEAADIVCCEDTRHTGNMLKLLGIGAKRLLSLHAHNEAERLDYLVGELHAGAKVALVSDAGTPVVSDPGERLVAAAADAGVEVVAVPGPSAVLAALVVSGMEIGRWRFEGFLPRRGPERRARIAEIAASPCPSVCYESPHRLAATLADLGAACDPDRRASVSRELTKLHETTQRHTLAHLTETFAAKEPKGEIVIVVAGAPPLVPTIPERAQLSKAVGELVAGGLSRRDAIRDVAAKLGVPRSAVYDAATRQQGGESPDR